MWRGMQAPCMRIKSLRRPRTPTFAPTCPPGRHLPYPPITFPPNLRVASSATCSTPSTAPIANARILPTMQTTMRCTAFRPVAVRRAGRTARLSVACVARPRAAAPCRQAEQQLDAPGLLYTAGAVLAPFLLNADAAFAKDGELGILEGRTAALVHPAIMISLFGASLYAGYLGYQWKRTREVGDEIKELKKQLPAPGPDGTRPPSSVDAAVEQKEKVRGEGGSSGGTGCPCVQSEACCSGLASLHAAQQPSRHGRHSDVHGVRMRSTPPPPHTHTRTYLPRLLPSVKAYTHPSPTCWHGTSALHAHEKGHGKDMMGMFPKRRRAKFRIVLGVLLWFAPCIRTAPTACFSQCKAVPPPPVPPPRAPTLTPSRHTLEHTV